MRPRVCVCLAVIVLTALGGIFHSNSVRVDVESPLESSITEESRSLRKSVAINHEEPKQILTQFVELNKKIIAGELPKKVMVYRSESGFANRMYGIVSVLLIAILTDSAFRLGDWGDLGTVFDTPIPDWAWGLSKEEMHDAARLQYIHEQCFFFGTPICKTLQYSANYSYVFDSQITSIKTNCPLYKSILSNNHTWQKLIEVGLLLPQEVAGLEPYIETTGSKLAFPVFRRLFTHFFTLKPKYQDELAEFRAISRDNFVIGFHIRTRFGANETEFARCARFIENNLLTNVTQPIKWFVAADDQIPIENLLKEFPQRVLFSSMEKAHIEGIFGDSDRKVALETTTTDILMLYMAHLRIITPGSTFGGLASLMAGTPPFATELDNNLDFRICYQTDAAVPARRSWGEQSW